MKFKYILLLLIIFLLGIVIAKSLFAIEKTSSNQQLTDTERVGCSVAKALEIHNPKVTIARGKSLRVEGKTENKIDNSVVGIVGARFESDKAALINFCDSIFEFNKSETHCGKFGTTKTELLNNNLEGIKVAEKNASKVVQAGNEVGCNR